VIGLTATANGCRSNRLLTAAELLPPGRPTELVLDRAQSDAELQNTIEKASGEQD